MSLELLRWPGPALAYHVLSHLDLRGDAATLFDSSLSPRPWVKRLERAYRDDPRRLSLQVVGLEVETVDELAGRASALGGELGRCFADAVDERREAFAEEFVEAGSAAESLTRGVEQAITEPLERLRAALWERSGGVPPPLRVLDCKALGHSGRATRVEGVHVVGVSLARPAVDVLLQVLHEEIHPITDPPVLEQVGVRRSTRVGPDGDPVHALLEETAITVGRALVEARAPELAGDYERWCATLGT